MSHSEALGSDLELIKKQADQLYILDQLGRYFDDETAMAGQLHSCGAQIPSEHRYEGLQNLFAYLQHSHSIPIARAQMLSTCAMWMTLQKELHDHWAQLDTSTIWDSSLDGFDSAQKRWARAWAVDEANLYLAGNQLALKNKYLDSSGDMLISGIEVLRALASAKHPAWPLHEIADLSSGALKTVLVQELSESGLTSWVKEEDLL
jgi:hypothetical protein